LLDLNQRGDFKRGDCPLLSGIDAENGRKGNIKGKTSGFPLKERAPEHGLAFQRLAEGANDGSYPPAVTRK
jgi:hypothetical protein